MHRLVQYSKPVLVNHRAHSPKTSGCRRPSGYLTERLAPSRTVGPCVSQGQRGLPPPRPQHCTQPPAGITLRGLKQGASPLRLGTRQGCLGSPSNSAESGWSGAVKRGRREYMSHGNLKERNKTVFIADDMVVYIGNLKQSAKTSRSRLQTVHQKLNAEWTQTSAPNAKL